MLTRKQLDGWNNADEREIRHATRLTAIFDLHLGREWRPAKW